MTDLWLQRALHDGKGIHPVVLPEKEADVVPRAFVSSRRRGPSGVDVTPVSRWRRLWLRFYSFLQPLSLCLGFILGRRWSFS
jgi:hypothetical protein